MQLVLRKAKRVILTMRRITLYYAVEVFNVTYIPIMYYREHCVL